MSTSEVALGLLCCLQPLTGPLASGNITVRATGVDVALPPFAFGVPVVTTVAGESYTDWAFPIRTLEPKTVTAAGVAVAARAVHGGPRSNLVAGTPIRWLPAIGGVETISVVAAGGFAGGSDPAEDSAVRSLVWSQEIPPTGEIGEDVIRAAVSRLPAVILTWVGSKTDHQAGRRKGQRIDRWMVVVVAEKTEDHHPRAHQALMILDLCHALLLDRHGVTSVLSGQAPRTMVVSAPGIAITARKARQSGPSLYAYEMAFETTTGVEGIDAPVGMYADWLQTRYDFRTAADETGSHPSTLDVVEAATYPQP